MMNKQILFSFLICLLTTIGIAQTVQEWTEQAQQSNDLEKRIEYYSNAIEMEKDNTNAYFNRGNTYRLMKDYDKAIEDFNTVIGLDSEDIDAYYLRGKTYLAMEEYQKALDDWVIVDIQREYTDYRYKDYRQAAEDGLNGVVYTTIDFEEYSYDFGLIEEGEKISHTFKFTNVGKEHLLISKAKGSCGCTVPEWSKESIAPGASSEIIVVFNSKNKKGKRNQKVTIIANTSPAQTFIYLTGEVKPAPKDAPGKEETNPFGLDFEKEIASPPPPPPSKKAKIEFEERQIDFGLILEGERVQKVFKFTNTGDVPFIIKDVKSGNSYLTWPKEPILPGSSGEITAVFNSKGKKGKRIQKITILSNAQEESIYMLGEVTLNPDIDTVQSSSLLLPLSKDAQIDFQYTQFDFGTIDEGETVTHTFEFTNTGAEPLLISNAKGGCGCTIPKWPKEAIAPGESGEITVDFNSKNKKGKRNQKVTITANTTPLQTYIYLTGEVLVVKE